MSNTTLWKSRRNLLLLFSIFIVPVVLAKLALDNNWFNKASTNGGELLKEELSITQLDINDEALQKKWLILYRLPMPCDDNCKQTIYGINQTFISLGREMDRVIPVALYATEFNSDELGVLKEKFWEFTSLPIASKDKLESKWVYVADPLGNIILKYAAPTSDEDVLVLGKAMLSDLRKLLKYSRIG
tara:strand:- start:19356 stop:19916 length:561 start_codon:yes stop_codon:yes gene_type:complete